MGHRRRPHRKFQPPPRGRRRIAIIVGVLALLVSVGLGMVLAYDVRFLGGPELVFAKDVSTGWSLLRKVIVIAPGIVSGYAIAGPTRRRNFLSAWLAIVTIALAVHIPVLLPTYVGPAVIVSIGVSQGLLALFLSRSSRFLDGLRSYEPIAPG
jgi:uncharacterized membrane protein (DUF485 family)